MIGGKALFPRSAFLNLRQTKSCMFGYLRMSLIHFVGLFAMLAMDAGPLSAQKTPLKIVDVHAHFLPGPSLDFDQAIESAIREMDKFGVARAIIMAPPRSKPIKLNYEYPDFRAAVNRYRSRFEFLAGGGGLNLALHGHANLQSVTDTVKQDFAAAARKAIDEGAKGFGEMGSLHISLSRAHVYSFVPADHPLLLVLADVAAERDVPLDLHMDALVKARKPAAALSKFPNNPGEFPATIPALERLLSHNSNAKIIWSHGGTDHLGDFSAKAINTLMNRHSNLYVSLKVVGPKAPTHNKLFSRKKVVPEWLTLLRRHPDRFMIGTDNFYVDPRINPSSSISGFAKANEPKLTATVRFLSLLPKDLSRKIASENAIRVFKLSPSQLSPVTATVQSGAASNRGAQGGLCRDGNMDHCKIACGKGVRAACNRLKRGK